VAPDPLQEYIEGWRRHDIGAVLSTLTPDCVVVECYGPTYRGRTRVQEWMQAWLGAGGRVDDWTITSSGAAPDLAVAEWVFTCTYGGDTATFEGASVARIEDGRISYLREYATTADRYDWTGTWRESG
jgi:ketosteroid isomerase-like protein